MPFTRFIMAPYVQFVKEHPWSHLYKSQFAPEACMPLFNNTMNMIHSYANNYFAIISVIDANT